MAMSGGVDSSVAAFLLKSQGHELIGGMIKMFDTEDISPEFSHSLEGGSDSSGGKKSPVSQRSCCTLSDADDARSVANVLEIPFYVFNFAQNFAEDVIEKFIRAYERGTTPNPCIDCNRFLKFEKFLRRATELDCDKIATGHYAQISADANGRYLLKCGADETKDQSYVLYAMTQEQLSRTVFPLGALKKEEVRALAEAQGFINAQKRDSQDICFAPDGDYAGFIERRTGQKKGRFIDGSGKILGEHKGIVHYTIGQRKGLGISAPRPLFVVAMDADENTITLGDDEQLFTNKLLARDLNFIPFDKINAPIKVSAKIRYAHTPEPATVFQTSEDEILCEFAKPQRAITPGQAVVFYDGDIVVGGATIAAQSVAVK
ncbi:MAG: tRNA 2-thiouridine(34) synthase MnmA [Defluviitaleaceae bacterium]|nr:tRNA 2-thiouridine(34) synthase MnmA [Defluviitaleaceae bacterium]